MLQSHRLDLLRSEKRERLTEISAKEEALTAEERAEIASISSEIKDIEAKYRAALHVEDTDKDKPEAREHKSLEDGLSLRNYIEACASGKPIEGREKEYAEQHSLSPSTVPWSACAPRERADAVSPGLADSDAPAMQHSVLDRVFAESATAFLGVRFESVGTGIQHYPVITAGTTAEVVAKDAVKESTAATISVVKASPKRLQARYSVRREDLSITPNLEESLRRDLSAVMSDQMDKITLTGTGTDPQPSGFLGASGGLPAASGNFAPSGVISYENWATLLASACEGKFASKLSDLRVLVGVETFSKLASVFRTGTSDNALAYSNREVSLRVSANLPAKASKKEKGIIVRGNPANSFISPVFTGITLIRDELSDASKGWIHITAYSLVDFIRVRDAQAQQFIVQVDA